ncbi:hypothetical protein K2173_025335 [Erythroxylum novogranatense]|uniref:Uncharacterized protein n=1 Tax=Erythroxylum novogranatense TaxID=1862640 RepID=A0AAV8UDN4_9ROSI|nr:hypothetical protein K2173_025335 [Erythroxylum novogranatense]
MLDVSKIQEIDLNPEVFMKISNLKFLKFYRWLDEQSNLRLSQGLDYLPNGLTYFHWDGYPLEFLPRNFRPNHLIVLRLPNSKIKQFQEEVNDKNIVYSVASQLSCEKFDTIFRHFCSLIKIPSYIYGWQLGKVTSLSLVDCKNISHIPSSGVGLLEAVEILNLSGCKNLKTFPKVSSNIKLMVLSWTAIEQIPSSSIEHLSKLEQLDMMYCDMLESLPNNFFDALTSLRTLYICKCSRLKKLPEISENMYNLQKLVLLSTEIELPSSIGNLKGLKFLQICYCSKLTFVRKSVVNLASLEYLLLEGYTSHHPVIDHSLLSWLLESVSSLKKLNLESLKIRELSEDLSFLSSVTYLNLSENNFERIPASIKQLSNLKEIRLTDCQRLISLPELPSSVFRLRANNCTSLEQIWSLKQLVFESEGTEKTFLFWNCLKLDEGECQEVADVLLGYDKPWVRYCMNYPGSRIPKWVKYQSMGDSVEVPNPSRWLNRRLLRVAFSVCIKSLRKEFHYTFLNLKSDCYFGDNNHVSFPKSLIFEKITPSGDALTENVVVVFHDIVCHSICGYGCSLGDVALFKFSFGECGQNMKILKCGVTPVCSQDQDELCQEFPTPKSTVKIEEAYHSLGEPLLFLVGEKIIYVFACLLPYSAHLCLSKFGICFQNMTEETREIWILKAKNTSLLSNARRTQGRHSRDVFGGDALDLFSWLNNDQTMIYWEELVQAFQENYGLLNFKIDEYLCDIKQTCIPKISFVCKCWTELQTGEGNNCNLHRMTNKNKPLPVRHSPYVCRVLQPLKVKSYGDDKFLYHSYGRYKRFLSLCFRDQIKIGEDSK